MISYIEKGAGLHDAVAAAGHALREENGVWISSDDSAVQAVIDSYSLADARAYRQAEVEQLAKVVRDRITRSVSPGEMASWSIKLAQAAAFASTGDPASAPLLAAEAQYRGITIEDLVSRVSSAAGTFAALEAQIAGMSGYHRDAIDALESFEAIASYDVTTGWP